MKRIIVTLFLLICFFNCYLPKDDTAYASDEICQQNAFRIVRYADSQGKISLSYIFPVNQKELKEKGFSEEEISVFRFYLTTYVNALAQSNKKQEIEGVEVKNCQYFVDIDGVGFSIVFDDVDIQNKFFKVEGDSSENSFSKRKTSGFFIKKLKIETVFPIASAKSADDLREICVMSINSWCDNEKISDAKRKSVVDIYNRAIYIYDFASLNKNLKSSVMYDDEIFHHNVFVKTQNDIEEDNKIVFWVEWVNKPVWYLFAVLVVVIGMISTYLILNFKQKEKL